MDPFAAYKENRKERSVLDIAITAARIGGRVTGLDLTPRLLARAYEDNDLAGGEIDQGDVEYLPVQFGSSSRLCRPRIQLVWPGFGTIPRPSTPT